MKELLKSENCDYQYQSNLPSDFIEKVRSIISDWFEHDAMFGTAISWRHTNKVMSTKYIPFHDSINYDVWESSWCMDGHHIIYQVLFGVALKESYRVYHAESKDINSNITYTNRNYLSFKVDRVDIKGHSDLIIHRARKLIYSEHEFDTINKLYEDVYKTPTFAKWDLYNRLKEEIML